LGVVVVGDMDDKKNGGMLGADMQRYAYYRVHSVVESNTVGGGELTGSKSHCSPHFGVNHLHRVSL